MSAHAGLAALVGQKIYALILPQTISYPAVSYTTISRTPEQTFGAGVSNETIRLQVDAWALTMDQCVNVAENIKAAITRYRGQQANYFIEHILLDNCHNDYDAAIKVYRVSQDFLVSYRN